MIKISLYYYFNFITHVLIIILITQIFGQIEYEINYVSQTKLFLRKNEGGLLDPTVWTTTNIHKKHASLWTSPLGPKKKMFLRKSEVVGHN